MMVTKRGRRVTRGPIVVHALLPGSGDGEPRAGFVVGKKVGNAVVRNRVRRRLREQVRPRLAQLPAGGMILVRALPPAADASAADLGQALDDALRTLTAREQAARDRPARDRPARDRPARERASSDPASPERTVAEPVAPR